MLSILIVSTNYLKHFAKNCIWILEKLINVSINTDWNIEKGYENWLNICHNKELIKTE